MLINIRILEPWATSSGEHQTNSVRGYKSENIKPSYEQHCRQEPALAILLMAFIVPALLGFISFFAVLLGAKAMLLLLQTSTGRHSDRERTPTSG